MAFLGGYKHCNVYVEAGSAVNSSDICEAQSWLCWLLLVCAETVHNNKQSEQPSLPCMPALQLLCQHSSS